MDIQYTYPDATPKLAMQRNALNDSVPCGDGVCFKSIVDVVNPLQQLPVIGSLYRSATGDTLSTFSRLAGGALMGGPLGFAAAAVNAAVEMMTGEDISGHVMAALDGISPQKAAAMYQNGPGNWPRV